MDYHYDSLRDEKSIRILTLHEGLDDESPPYETVSYVWGSSGKTHHVLIDGARLGITTSLDTALRQLRQTDRPLFLWVDAVCIHQDDKCERAKQVQMMGEIFKRCARVYLCFGSYIPHKSSNVNPFYLVRHFAENQHLYELPGFKRTSRPGHWVFDDNAEFREIWASFICTNSVPWWTRLWCVQEVWLPPQAEIVYGQWRLPWKMTVVSEQLYNRHIDSCCKEAFKALPSKYNTTTDQLVQHEGTYRATEKSSEDLEFVCRSYRHKRCQDPKDKIYGLLGLVRSNNFVADYTGEVRVVYQRAMLSMLNGGQGSLRALTGTSFNSQCFELPSWVRNFADTPSLARARSEQGTFEAYHLYNASGGRKSQVSVDGPRLKLQGFHIDRVSLVGSTVDTSKPHDAIDVFRTWQAMAGLEFPNTRSDLASQNQKCFWKTVLADLTFDPVRSWSRISDKDEERTLDMMSSYLSESEEGKNLGVLYDRFFLKANRSAICGRAMFVTERGHIGLCFPTTKPGDEIWVLDGGNVPFVLRRPIRGMDSSDTNYTFVGECYLDGFMDGQGAQDQSRSDKPVIIV